MASRPTFKAMTNTLLNDHGWTQEALAVECGCTRQTISYIANGITKQPGYTIGAGIVRLWDALPSKRAKA